MDQEIADQYGIELIGSGKDQKPKMDGKILANVSPGEAIAVVIWQRQTPCIHRGSVTGETVKLAKCSNKHTPLFDCAIYQQCSVQPTNLRGRVVFCQRCGSCSPV